LVMAVRITAQRRSLPWPLVLTWIGVNALGMATHYFFALTLICEASTLLWVCGLRGYLRDLHAGRWWAVMLGTLLSAVVWLPTLLTGQDEELTRWIQQGASSHWYDPLLRTLAGWVTMLYMLPVQQVSSGLAIAAGVVLIGLTLGTVVLVGVGIRWQYRQPANQLPMQVLAVYSASAIALGFGLTYLGSTDFASVFRYQFFYAPALLLLVALGLASLWQDGVGRGNRYRIQGKVRGGRLWVMLMLCASLMGGLTVITNGGYQKTHRPDRVAQVMQQDWAISAASASGQLQPALVTILHRNHGQTGRLMGVAWALEQTQPQAAVSYLLAHQPGDDPAPAIAVLSQATATQARPFTLWRINFRDQANNLSDHALTQEGCQAASKMLSADGYRYQPYRCGPR
jgi:uncharacterized membrane protein